MLGRVVGQRMEGACGRARGWVVVSMDDASAVMEDGDGGGIEVGGAIVLEELANEAKVVVLHAGEDI